MTVSDVAGDNLDLVQSRNILQPAPEIERVILGQRCYVRSGAQQMFDQVGADESISPRYKNAFALKFHLAELSPHKADSLQRALLAVASSHLQWGTSQFSLLTSHV